MFQSAFSGVSTDNINKAKEFYSETLGLKLVNEQMGLEYELPGNSGSFFIYEKSDHKPATYTFLNFAVKDIKSTVDKLKSQGIKFEQYDFGGGAETDRDGIMWGLPTGDGPNIAWFKDPAGNTLAVLQNHYVILYV